MASTTRPWPSSGSSATPPALAEALYNQSFVAVAASDLDGAAGLLDESLELFRLVGDEPVAARA